MNQLIREVEAPHLRTDIPYFRPGDTITVSVRVVEGDKERIQDYTGVVIARKHGGLRETITVRRVSYGVGMERVFPLHSPRVAGIKVKRRGRVRRAKLYYLRNLSGKKARLVERKVTEEKLAAEAAISSKALEDQIALLDAPAPEVPAIDETREQPPAEQAEQLQEEMAKETSLAGEETANDPPVDASNEQPSAEAQQADEDKPKE